MLMQLPQEPVEDRCRDLMLDLTELFQAETIRGASYCELSFMNTRIDPEIAGGAWKIFSLQRNRSTASVLISLLGHVCRFAIQVDRGMMSILDLLIHLWQLGFLELVPSVNRLRSLVLHMRRRSQ